MTRKGTLVAAVGFTVFLVGGSGAAKSLHDSSLDRIAFAARHFTSDDEPVRLSTAGLRETILVIETNPPDRVSCGQTLAVVAADRDFIQQVSAVGFTQIECFAYGEDGTITSDEIRNIVPAKPPAPFKSRHSARIAVA